MAIQIRLFGKRLVTQRMIVIKEVWSRNGSRACITCVQNRCMWSIPNQGPMMVYKIRYTILRMTLTYLLLFVEKVVKMEIILGWRLMLDRTKQNQIRAMITAETGMTIQISILPEFLRGIIILYSVLSFFILTEHFLEQAGMVFKYFVWSKNGALLNILINYVLTKWYCFSADKAGRKAVQLRQNRSNVSIS